eukprot:TRINITY_DN23227_c0_g1_i2.p1 TRINITY_DN23227_c0_g1~~TRINITY_DN23227_c0_g1_i2.p1  ORF type:complete len:284 (-),score=84.64 TRINITY_DN23227_c0_g1_i2:85-936(-)
MCIRDSWNTVLGNKKNEAAFLDNEGFYVLLDFLETCDEMHKKQCLSAICSLIENQKAIDYFCEWNSSRTMINATQLLISIYEKEDLKFGVKYKEGVLQNIDRPLNPKAPRSKSTTLLGGTKSRTSLIEGSENKTLKGFARLKDALKAGESDSTAGNEAYLARKIRERVHQCDLRAIIFSILYRTGFDRNELQQNERQRLEIIQFYPNLKLGEIWQDIRDELIQNKVKPTFDDYHWMATAVEEFQERVLSCVATQSLIAKEKRRLEEEDLGRFFDLIKNNKISK